MGSAGVRAFGIPVRVHIFFFIITLGLFLREVDVLGDVVWWVDILLLTVVVLFGIILVHEFGHCFGARWVGGDAKEVLIWPLGGLAFVDVPNTPRANFIAAAAGPAVNVVICAICALAMAAAGFYPTLNPVVSPYRAEVHNFNGRTYTSAYGLKLYYQGTSDEADFKQSNGLVPKSIDAEEFKRAAAANGLDRALAPVWVSWTYRIFWLSWVLLLFNLLPAYPLDGGQMLQAIVWGRTDYRRGVVVAAYTGFGVSVLFLLISIAKNESLFMGLALFMFYTCSMKLHSLEMEDGPFGYDFSAGYTSLDRDEPPKRVGYFTRWKQARRARKQQREVDQRQQDEERMDQLLEKIARAGKGSLSEEERRFLERVSARYRNR